MLSYGRICALLLWLTPAAGWPADASPLPSVVPPAGVADVPVPPWHVVGLPQQSKPYTHFSVVNLDGQRVLEVEADSSYGNLVYPLPDNHDLRHLAWRWRLDQPLPAADLRHREGDDSAIKVCAMFDLPMSAVPFLERQLLRVARMRSGEPLPSASVCYVWDSHLPPGTVLPNAFTRRIRFITLHGPEAPLHTWVSEQRNVSDDFLRLFADEADKVPALLGVAIGADADNTKGHSLAHLGAIDLEP